MLWKVGFFSLGGWYKTTLLEIVKAYKTRTLFNGFCFGLKLERKNVCFETINENYVVRVCFFK